MRTSRHQAVPLAAAAMALLLAFSIPSALRADEATTGPTIRVVGGGGAVIDISKATSRPATPFGNPADPAAATHPANAPSSQPSTSPLRIATQPSSAPTRSASEPATKPAKTVADCLERYNKGDYADAIEGYKKFLGDKTTLLAASIGLARAQQMKGDYDEAIDSLSRSKDPGEADADWQVEMAQALSNVGRYEDALPHAQKACKLRGDWGPAIFCLGQLLETVGRKTEAIAAYKEMEKATAKDDWKKDARDMVALGQILDRFTILTGKKASAQGDNIYQNYFQAAYTTVDGNYWPAHVAAGMFALSKHRPNMAAGDFQAAAKINRYIPDVHVGMGLLNVGAMRFEAAIKEANEAIAINPHMPAAHLLKAVALMSWHRPLEAVPHIEQALQTNPNDTDSLATMASAYLCARQPDKAQPFIDRAEKVNPACADMYSTIGQWLSSIRQFDDAEKYLLKAIDLAPEMPEPRTELGILYMQTGEEDKARDVLAKAHELDDYRADVVNYIEILNKLSKFLVRETQHFIVKVDPETDSVLLNQVCDYMEEIYPKVCRDYDYQLQHKVIIEIFPTQTGFATRLSGQGWIPTVGACTGRVIVLAAPSPEDRTPLSTYNWAVVLRHEFTHAVTLAATENRIPHWFTEALAVWQQPDKHAYQHIQTLVTATRMGKLFPLKDIDWGFIRPKGPNDRNLAYAESEWIVEYLIATHKYDIIPRMNKGFRDGLTQAEVFEKIVGVSETDFDKAFNDWAHKQVKDWGFNPDPPPDLKESTKAAEDRPADPNAQAAYAVALYYAGRGKNALAAADKALALDSDSARALAIRALVLLGDKQYDDALDAASRLDKLDPRSFISPRVEAECYLNMKGDKVALTADAIKALETFKERQPLEEYSYQQLASIYMSLGMSDKALPNLIHLHIHTMNDAKYARQAAEIYRSQKKYDQALEYFREATYINPYDPGVYEAIASLEIRAKKYPEAVEAAKDMTLLQHESSKAWAVLANVRLSAARAANNDKDGLLEAQQDAQKSISLDPDGPGKDILENINEAMKP